MVDTMGFIQSRSSAGISIDNLISNRISEIPINKADLVRRWGYANLGKGLRRLEQLRAGHFVPDEKLLERLAQALDLSLAELSAAVSVTQEKRKHDAAEVEYRNWLSWCKNFEPHVLLRTERQVPTQIFIVAMVGADRFLRVDIDHSRPRAEWMSQIIPKLPDTVPCFGSVTGFYINYAPNMCAEYDRLGNLQNTYETAKRPGKASFHIKGRDQTDALRAVLGQA